MRIQNGSYTKACCNGELDSYMTVEEDCLELLAQNKFQKAIERAQSSRGLTEEEKNSIVLMICQTLIQQKEFAKVDELKAKVPLDVWKVVVKDLLKGSWVNQATRVFQSLARQNKQSGNVDFDQAVEQFSKSAVNMSAELEEDFNIERAPFFRDLYISLAQEGYAEAANAILGRLRLR